MALPRLAPTLAPLLVAVTLGLAGPAGAEGSCHALRFGVEACGLKAEDFSTISPTRQGGLKLVMGDTTATLNAGGAAEYSAPISEGDRQFLQGGFHSQEINRLINALGVEPRFVIVEALMNAAAGPGGANAPMADVQFMRLPLNGAEVTFGSTLFLGPDYYVLLISMNPGAEASSEHEALIGATMGSLVLPDEERIVEE